MPVLSPTDVRALLAENGLHPSRALGQNFLADANTAQRIARLAEIGSTDRVVEIGPGLGSLTLALAATGAHVVAVELDRHLIPVLEEVVADAGDVTVEHGDALEYDFAARLGRRRMVLRVEPARTTSRPPSCCACSRTFPRSSASWSWCSARSVSGSSRHPVRARTVRRPSRSRTTPRPG